MNRKGFTLIELLIVLAIISIASAGSILVFDRTDVEGNKRELKKTYVRVQRAANIYLDMNDSWRNQFNEKKYIFLKINELQNENFVESDLINPVDLESINSSNSILIYVSDDNEVDSCIVSGSTSFNCVANSDGNPCDCCTKQTAFTIQSDKCNAL